jgi:hypothetical protein
VFFLTAQKGLIARTVDTVTDIDFGFITFGDKEMGDMVSLADFRRKKLEGEAPRAENASSTTNQATHSDDFAKQMEENRRSQKRLAEERSSANKKLVDSMKRDKRRR